jgi:hypothetical protein
MMPGNIIVLVPPRENAIYFTIGIAMGQPVPTIPV